MSGQLDGISHALIRPAVACHPERLAKPLERPGVVSSIERNLSRHGEDDCKLPAATCLLLYGNDIRKESVGLGVPSSSCRYDRKDPPRLGNDREYPRFGGEIERFGSSTRRSVQISGLALLCR